MSDTPDLSLERIQTGAEAAKFIAARAVVALTERLQACKDEEIRSAIGRNLHNLATVILEFHAGTFDNSTNSKNSKLLRHMTLSLLDHINAALTEGPMATTSKGRRAYLERKCLDDIAACCRGLESPMPRDLPAPVNAAAQWEETIGSPR